MAAPSMGSPFMHGTPGTGAGRGHRNSWNVLSPNRHKNQGITPDETVLALRRGVGKPRGSIRSTSIHGTSEIFIHRDTLAPQINAIRRTEGTPRFVQTMLHLLKHRDRLIDHLTLLPLMRWGIPRKMATLIAIVIVMAAGPLKKG